MVWKASVKRFKVAVMLRIRKPNVSGGKKYYDDRRIVEALSCVPLGRLWQVLVRPPTVSAQD